MVIVKRRGRHVVDYYEPGNIRRRLSFKSSMRAQEFVRNLGRDESPSDTLNDITLKDVIRRYYETESISKSEDAYRNEKYTFSSLYDFLSDELKLRYLNEVQLIHLDQFRAYLRKTRQASSVNRMFSTYKAFFNKCVDWDLIAKSPSQRLRKMPEDKTAATLWDDRQLTQSLKALPSWAADVIYFLAETSARPIEARRLICRDIDHKAAVVRLKSFKGTGEARVRVMALAPAVARFLRAHTKGASPDRNVFLNSRGLAITRNCLCTAVRKTRESLGYEKLTSYGLRHTYLTKLVEMNVNLLMVQRIAGHSKPSTTERYVQLKDQQLGKVVDLMSRRRKLKRTGHKPVTKVAKRASF